MFAHFRRHKWLWVIIFGLTIISFVAFFSPQVQYASGGGYRPDEAIGSIDGKPITRDDYGQLLREATLRFFFTYQQWPQESQMARQFNLLDQEVRNRALLTHKIQEYDIRVTDSAAAAWIANVFRDENGRFLEDVYRQFVDETLRRQGLTKRDFERFVRNEVAIQHLVGLAGLPGKLITPQEAEREYRMQHEQVDTAALFVQATNYLSQVEMNPEAIAQHYTNTMAIYRIPERYQLLFVRFDATNYMGEVEQKLSGNTNLASVIDSVYIQNATNYVDDANNPLPPEQAKEKIRSELFETEALREAQRKAIAFAEKLLEMPNEVASLEKAAEEEGLTAQLTQPFQRGFPTPELSGVTQLQRVLPGLTAEAPISYEPMVGQKSVFLVALKEIIPSETRPFETVQTAVAEDYKRQRSRELAQEAGKQLRDQIAAAMAEGKSFEEAANGTQGQYVDLAPFSRETTTLPGLPGGVSLTSIRNSAFALSPGELSEFESTTSGGFILFLQGRVALPDDQVKAALPEFVRSRQDEAQNEAFARWFRKEMELSALSLPGDESVSAAN